MATGAKRLAGQLGLAWHRLHLTLDCYIPVRVELCRPQLRCNVQTFQTLCAGIYDDGFVVHKEVAELQRNTLTCIILDPSSGAILTPDTTSLNLSAIELSAPLDQEIYLSAFAHN